MAEVYAFINTPTVIYIFAGTFALVAIGRLLAFTREFRVELLLTSIVTLLSAVIAYTSMDLMPLAVGLIINWLLTAFLNRNL